MVYPNRDDKTRKNSAYVLTILLVMASVISITFYAQSAAAVSAYRSGYNHGCSDARNGDQYINTPGKGPSFHTDEFMRGYDDGHNACSGSGSGSGGNFGGGGQSRTSLVDTVCNFAQTKPALASAAAIALGYPGLDVAVRALCSMR